MNFYLKKYLILAVLIIVLLFWMAALSYPSTDLRLIACNVGQGDAILITYGKFQILTDGGLPDGKASECLRRHIPFWDRRLEAVVLTHPEIDHYGGLIEILRNYNVSNFIAGSLDPGTPDYELLINTVGSRGIKVITASEGTTIRYGLIKYDIFWPSTEFLSQEGYSNEGKELAAFKSKKNTNDFSLQALLSFGKFKALLTGDIGMEQSVKVLKEIDFQTINYIKIPHHGSKNALTTEYLKLFSPEIAVISVGENNYGHPSPEIIELLDNNKIKYFRTDQAGDITVETDGERIFFK